MGHLASKYINDKALRPIVLGSARKKKKDEDTAILRRTEPSLRSESPQWNEQHQKSDDVGNPSTPKAIQKEMYKQNLSPKERAVYDSIRDGIAAFKQSVRIPFVNDKDLSRLFSAVVSDHPEFFFIEGRYKYRTDETSFVCVEPAYAHSAASTKETMIKIKQKIEDLLKNIGGLDEYEKELRIHDFLCREVR